MIVWDAPGFGFGDLFVAVNFCIHQSAKTRLPAYISEWAGFDQNINQRSRLQEIIDALQIPQECSVIIVPELATTRMHGEPWGCRYFPTKERWIGDDGYLAYQFDGRSSAELKNPPPEDLERFLSWVAKQQLPLKYVGLPATVAECIALLRHARLFVGANSGMSHLALAVGAPTFVVEYGVKIDWWYGPNAVRKCVGMDDFLQKVDRTA